jgi:hypothetical protein
VGEGEEERKKKQTAHKILWENLSDAVWKVRLKER